MTGMVRWGVLGTARIAEVMLLAMNRSGHAEAVAVASRDGDKAAAFAADYGLRRSFGSYDALLESNEVDAIYVALPNGLHTKWAGRAASAGKHVLCEKPFGRDPEKVASAFDRAERSGVVMAEALMYRYHPQTKLARKLVDEAAIGKAAYIKGTLSFTMEGQDVRAFRALDGGSLMDLGCYCVSAARLFTGEPERVYAESVTAGREIDMQLAASMRMPGDVLVQFDCGFVLPRRDRLEIVGSEGWIVLSDPWLCRSPTIELHRGAVTKDVPVDPGGGHGLLFDGVDVYRGEVDAVSKAILDGGTLAFGRDDAMGQACALDALLRSAEQQVPVQVHADGIEVRPGDRRKGTV